MSNDLSIKEPGKDELQPQVISMPSYANAPLAAHAALGMGTLCCVSMEVYFVDNVDIVKICRVEKK